MASVVLKVVASSPAPGQLPGKESELTCTHHSNGHSPLSPRPPELVSPLPLEATPLPPSLPSPVPDIPVENGLDACKKVIEGNTLLKGNEQEENVTKPFPFPVSSLLLPVSSLSLPVSSLPLQVSSLPLQVSSLPLQVSSLPLQVSSLPLPVSSLPFSVHVAPPIESSPSSLPAVEAVVSMMQLPNSNVKVMPVKLAAVDTVNIVKAAVIPVQKKPFSALEKFIPVQVKLIPHRENVAAVEKVEKILPVANEDVVTKDSRVSPPSLHANEEMLEDDSEEEMDIGTNSLPLPPQSGLDLTLPQAPSVVPPSACSRDSASPYIDDDFAMFVAQEAHEMMEPVLDAETPSLSPSPTPTPTLSSNDQLLPTLYEGSDGVRGGSSHIQHFGVTASCPSIPLQLSKEAPNAPLDMTSHNFPKRSKYADRAAISAMHPYNRTRGGANVAKTLDLMKAVLQPSLNMEIKRLCDDYKQIFAMAATNIHENTGDTVPPDTLQLLIVKMLDEAHQGYVHGKWEFPTKKLPQNEKVSSAKGSPMSTKKNKSEKDTRCTQTKKQRKIPSERQNENRPFGWRWGMDRRRLNPLNWNSDKLDVETYFVLGVSVNKALGHAANRGKVYYLHPELFKYACDGDDKTWLYENKHLPVHGGKAFLMIYSEVEALVKTEDCYKDNQDVFNCTTKLEQFPVPIFMLDKMKNFIKSVQGYFTQEASSSSSSASATSSSTATTTTTTTTTSTTT